MSLLFLGAIVLLVSVLLLRKRVLNTTGAVSLRVVQLGTEAVRRRLLAAALLS